MGKNKTKVNLLLLAECLDVPLDDLQAVTLRRDPLFGNVAGFVCDNHESLEELIQERDEWRRVMGLGVK
jgi:hypothetical protein